MPPKTYLIFLLALLWTVACREQPTPSPTPIETPTQAVALGGTSTATLLSGIRPATPTGACVLSQPPGWEPYQIQAGDTLSVLAETRNVSQSQVMAVNCLTTETLIQGEQLFLPTLPTPTPCQISPEPGWVPYTIRQGDTLTGLAAQRPGAQAAAIAQANCLQLDDTLFIGNLLYLPPLPTPTPTSTPTVTPTPTLTPTPAPPTPIPPTPLPVIVSIPVLPPPRGINPGQGGSGPDRPGNGPGGPPPEPPGFISQIMVGGSGDPNAGTIPLTNQNPCRSTQGMPDWWPLNDPITVSHRLYLYACNVTSPISATLTSIMNSVITTEPILPQERMPHFDLIEFQPHQNQATYLTWPVLPDTPPGPLVVELDYTIPNVSPPQRESLLPLLITVVTPTTPISEVLVVPTGQNSNSYIVYYANFTPTVTHRFARYRETVQPSPRITDTHVFSRTMEFVEEWQVTIPATQTWITKELRLEPGEPDDVAHAIFYGGVLSPTGASAVSPTTPQSRRPDWFFWPAYLNKEKTP